MHGIKIKPIIKIF